MLKYFSRKFSSSASSSFLPLKQTVLVSGIQPTGTPHLGNYLGALKNWVQKQENCHQAFFAIVDLHAITMPHNPKVLRENIIEGVIALLSCGLKSNQKTHQNVHIIQQSCIKEVCELAWIFSCICPNGRLDRMTQWKSKSHSIQATASLGLYAYPVLQAADVLLYKFPLFLDSILISSPLSPTFVPPPLKSNPRACRRRPKTTSRAHQSNRHHF
eukprot:Sdes_comp20718_c0_seq2m16434